MWYDVIPSGGVLLGLMASTFAVPPIVAWVVRSNRKYPRRYFHGSEVDYRLYVRDIYKFGSVYKPQGLEALDKA